MTHDKSLMLQLNSKPRKRNTFMSVWLAMLIGGCIGVVITTMILSNTRNGLIQAEYEKYISELELEH